MATAWTIQQIVDMALRRLAIAPGTEAPPAAYRTNGLQALQLLLAEWSGEGLSVPFVTQEAITMVASQHSYTVGENGSPDLNTVRPEKIDGAFVRDSNNYDYHVDVIGERAFTAIVAKDSAASRPQVLWYNPTVPNGTAYVDPTPDSTDSLYIVHAAPMTEPATLGESALNTTGVARNYHNALSWCLAEQMAPMFGKQVPRTVEKMAERGYNRIVSLNAARRRQAAVIDTPGQGGSGSYCILTD